MYQSTGASLHNNPRTANVDIVSSVTASSLKGNFENNKDAITAQPVNVAYLIWIITVPGFRIASDFLTENSSCFSSSISSSR